MLKYSRRYIINSKERFMHTSSKIYGYFKKATQLVCCALGILAASDCSNIRPVQAAEKKLSEEARFYMQNYWSQLIRPCGENFYYADGQSPRVFKFRRLHFSESPDLLSQGRSKEYSWAADYVMVPDVFNGGNRESWMQNSPFTSVYAGVGGVGTTIHRIKLSRQPNGTYSLLVVDDDHRPTPRKVKAGWTIPSCQALNNGP
jgi:hypothetical protein